MNKKHQKRGIQRLWYATGYAFEGLRLAWQREAAFRQEALAGLVLVPLALALPVDPMARLLLIGSWLAVLIVELLNSAVEHTVDLVTVEFHPLAKAAKDLGAAAVMLSLIAAALVWAVILWNTYQG